MKRAGTGMLIKKSIPTGQVRRSLSLTKKGEEHPEGRVLMVGFRNQLSLVDKG